MSIYKFDDSVSSWINVCFIGAGVAAGLLIGKYCNKPENFGIVLKSLFFVAAVANIVSAILCASGFVKGSDSASLVVMMILAAFAGATTLGFIGIGIEAAATYPAGAGYACWFVEIIVQGVGGGLGLLVGNKEGFITLGAVCAAGFLTIMLTYRRFADEK